MSDPSEASPPNHTDHLAVDDAVLEASRRSHAEPPSVRRTRPPTWLIVLTVMIPIAIGTVWWKSSWLNRLSAVEITRSLEGSDAHQQARALASFADKVDDYVKARNKAADSRETVGYLAEVEACRSQVLDFALRDDFSVRELIPHAVRTLGYFSALNHLGDQARARDKLEDYLNHQELHVRYQAATSLSMYGDRSFQVIDTLKSMLEESDQNVVLNAIIALGKVGDASTAPLLQRIAGRNDLEPEIRQYAQAAHDASSARSPQAR